MVTKVPSYRLHKPSGKAVVSINGKDYYLGKYNSAESKLKYKQIIAEYLTNPLFGIPSNAITIRDVLASYQLHAEKYYPVGSELENLKMAMRPVRELYADLPATSFGPIHFKAVREHWLNNGDRSRQYVNAQMKRLRRIIKWAVGEGIIPSSVHETLKCIAPLMRGRTNAREADPILPVEYVIVEQTLKFMSPVVADMVRFQMATGCRPGEVCAIKPSMVDRSGEVWEIHLDKHKTAWRGKKRVIYCGPKAQQVLAKYLLRDQDSACFSPREAELKRQENRIRNTPLNCGNRAGYSSRTRAGLKPKCRVSEQYVSCSYARAILYACDRAFPVPEKLSDTEKKAWYKQHRWAPNRIRHSVATDLRKHFGLEAASVILGHSEIAVTQVYAEADTKRAIEVAAKFG